MIALKVLNQLVRFADNGEAVTCDVTTPTRDVLALAVAIAARVPLAWLPYDNTSTARCPDLQGKGWVQAQLALPGGVTVTWGVHNVPMPYGWRAEPAVGERVKRYLEAGVVLSELAQHDLRVGLDRLTWQRTCAAARVN